MGPIGLGPLAWAVMIILARGMADVTAELADPTGKLFTEGRLDAHRCLGVR